MFKHNEWNCKMYMYIYIYTYIHTYIHTYMYMYIYTHMDISLFCWRGCYGCGSRPRVPSNSLGGVLLPANLLGLGRQVNYTPLGT